MRCSCRRCIRPARRRRTSAKILGGTGRHPRAFSEFQSHSLFADKFGRPAKGNDKGKVEGLVGYARNFMVPVPCFATWDAFHAHLEAESRKRRERKLRGRTETIAEHFERDRAALPEVPYESCEKVSARVGSLAPVRYKNNDYSVPTRHGHLQVLVRGYVHEVALACGSEVIAKHPRSYKREQVIVHTEDRRSSDTCIRHIKSAPIRRDSHRIQRSPCWNE